MRRLKLVHAGQDEADIRCIVRRLVHAVSTSIARQYNLVAAQDRVLDHAHLILDTGWFARKLLTPPSGFDETD